MRPNMDALFYSVIVWFLSQYRLEGAAFASIRVLIYLLPSGSSRLKSAEVSAPIYIYKQTQYLASAPSMPSFLQAYFINAGCVWKALQVREKRSLSGVSIRAAGKWYSLISQIIFPSDQQGPYQVKATPAISGVARRVQKERSEAKEESQIVGVAWEHS